jgi:DNA polymerase-3 subunit epsilon
MKFLAIDFETANYQRTSACALGLVKVEDCRIIYKRAYLIRPPQKEFVFDYLHGITWEQVKNEPPFGELWSHISPLFRDVDFIVAHNKSFDRSVLEACCAHAGITMPQVRFECTMEQARRLWNIYPTRLPDVCRHFGIALDHHDALSDTLACAHIMIKALEKDNSLFHHKI